MFSTLHGIGKNFFYCKTIFFFLKVWWLDATLFCLLWFFITYINSFDHNTFIRRHSLKPLSISSSLMCSVGKTSLWCRAENRTRACLTASRRAANWATPHHLSHAAPCWATPHHTEPRRTILSHAAPYWATPHHNWATPHHTEPRRTILQNNICYARFTFLYSSYRKSREYLFGIRIGIKRCGSTCGSFPLFNICWKIEMGGGGGGKFNLLKKMLV